MGDKPYAPPVGRQPFAEEVYVEKKKIGPKFEKDKKKKKKKKKLGPDKLDPNSPVREDEYDTEGEYEF